MAATTIINPTLIALSGPLKRKKVLVSKDSFVLGNNHTADLKVPGERVAKIHAVIEKDQFGTWQIISKSDAGVLVNKQHVEKATLNIGDLIQVGETTLFKFEGKVAKTSRDRNKEVLQSSEGVKIKKPVLYLLGAYLLLMAGVGIYLSLDFSTETETGLSNEYVSSVLDSTKEYLINLTPDAKTNSSDILFDKNRDISATYYNIKNSTISGTKNSLVDSLIAELENSFFRAWKLERTKNYQEALAEYQRILNLVPDNQAVTTKVASWRINVIKDKSRKR